MKRVGIFAFFDKSGIVKKYVSFLLKETKKELDTLVVVCNQSLSDEEIAKLKESADEVFVRDNRDFDAGAYKEAIFSFIGMERLYEYDEVVLFNNSFYGPFCPFSHIFQSMEKKEADFWGMTAGGQDERGTSPYHIHSYFICIRLKNVLQEDFVEYWETQESMLFFNDAIRKFEFRFTDYFLKKGYSCTTYVDDRELLKVQGADGNVLSRLCYELVVQCGCPIAKRKFLLNREDGQSPKDILDYLEHNTEYDTDMIWEDMISERTPYELLIDRQLYFFLSESGCSDKEHEYPEIFMDTCVLNTLQDMMWSLDKESLNIKEITHLEEIKLENISDEIVGAFVKSDNIGEASLFYRIMEDKYNKMLYSPDYLQQIVNIFHENQRLGVLFPKPNNLLITANPYDEYVLSDDFFWCRKSILKAWTNMLQDMPHRLLCDTSQNMGYFTAYVDNVKTMKHEMALTDILFRECLKETRKSMFYTCTLDFRNGLKQDNILIFAKRFPKVYIYGAGLYGKGYYEVLQRGDVNVDGFIVSNGQPKREVYGMIPKELKEVEDEECGIIVALDRDNQEQVKELLKNIPQDRVFYIQSIR